MANKRTAKDIMQAPVIMTRGDALVTDVMDLMARSRISGMPVVDDDGNLVGWVTGRLVMNTAISGNAARTRVSEIMSKESEIYGPAYAPDTPVEDLVNHFAASRINRVLIVEDGKIAGIVCRSDIIAELNRIYGGFVVKG